MVDGRFNVNNHAHLIEATIDCSVEWFSQYFKHKNIIQFLSRQGAGRYKLNKETLQKIPILLPPISEQTAIADLLSIWDKAIEKIGQLIEKNSNLNPTNLKLLSMEKSRTILLGLSPDQKSAKQKDQPNHTLR